MTRYNSVGFWKSGIRSTFILKLISSTLTHDRPLWLKRPSTILLERPFWLKWPSSLAQDRPLLDRLSTLDQIRLYFSSQSPNESRPRFLEILKKCLSQHDDHQLTTTPAPVTDNQHNKCVLPEVSPKLTSFWSTTSYRLSHTVNVGREQLVCNLFGLVE